ncbi:EF-hand domain-containing protein [Streptomyces sp. BI20]|uniref:EF-hand domain-containing protein n=1 Tax=Streptomyces sp. BI20 TaxID=3403460 RepID=UPI003C75AE7B
MADIDTARATFDRFDKDGDGYITAAEYREAMAVMGDYAVTGPVAEAVIKAKDLNEDNRLSFDEFRSSLG